MHILLVSTYELGRQPVHVASPAAALSRAGHEVRVSDLSIGQLSVDDLDWADRIGISVPMHTATRLADEVTSVVRGEHPDKPIALYGLYAGVASASVDARFEGEYEPGLLQWAAGNGDTGVRHLGRSDFSVPDRSQLPALGEYARLEWDGRTEMVGAVEASHGCRHRCRHCPIPAVYDGRIRVAPRETVLADIDNLVANGAGHVTFGDADFFNAPAHSFAVLESAHDAHPSITFDATIKVEHLVDHPDLVPRLAAANVLFVVSAFESVDDYTLDVLDKGHTVDDMAEAVRLTRDAGVHIRPTWLPFMPWTTTDDVADIFEFIAIHELGSATDPVQMAIKLLVPRGSLLEEHDSMTRYLAEYDTTALTWRWSFAHHEVEVLCKDLESLAAEASDCGEEVTVTLNTMRHAVGRASERDLPPLAGGRAAPRLTESWFCCAEPTTGQSVSIGLSAR